MTGMGRYDLSPFFFKINSQDVSLYQMNIEIHQQGETKIAEVIADHVLFTNPEEGLQLLVDLYYQDFNKIILHEKNIPVVFFDLKTGLAGEILQKFSNFRVQLVIVGEFGKHLSNSLKNFIAESNKGAQVNFLPNIAEARQRLFNKN